MAAPTFLRTHELRAGGMGRRGIARAVASGGLIRVRTGRYVPAETPDELILAARLGVRLDCVSLLRHRGVFVLSHDRVHVQANHGDSRLPIRPRDLVCHWRRGRGPRAALEADLLEALAQACRCQPPRAAIATLDSAWHRGDVDEGDLAEVFALLPPRYGVLRPLLDIRSESGPESLMRLILRSLGCAVEVQVLIDGVGRVDFVVDGWLIIECDSEAHHGGWVAQRRDRRRDLAAAAQGYTTVRPIAEDILHRPDELRAQLRDILDSRAARVPNSSRPRRSAALRR